MRKKRHLKVPLFMLSVKISIMGIVVGKLTILILPLDMGMRHLNIGSDKDKVYLLHFVGRNLTERMPRASSTCVIVRHVVGIVHLELIRYHSGISFIALGHIEVACNHSRLVSHYLLNFPHDKFGAFATGHFTHVSA